MAENAKLICNKCKVTLEEIDAYFTYLDRKLKHKVTRCPECGQIYMQEELIKGKVKLIETSMEDK